MIRGLTKVSWERVDVSFKGSKQRHFAHTAIQACICSVFNTLVTYRGFLHIMFRHYRSSYISPHTNLLWPRQISFPLAIYSGNVISCLCVFIHLLSLMCLLFFPKTHKKSTFLPYFATTQDTVINFNIMWWLDGLLKRTILRLDKFGLLRMDKLGSQG